MLKKLILPTAEFSSEIVNRMAPYTGHAAYYSNPLNLIYRIVANYLDGDVMSSSQCELVRTVIDYGVSDADVAEDIVLTVRNRLITSLQTYFGTNTASAVWDYELNTLGDLTVTRLDQDTSQIMAEGFASHLKQLQDDAADGAYIPRNLRQLIGG